MGTNGTNIAVEPTLEEEIFGIQIDHGRPLAPLDKTPAGRRPRDNRGPEAGYPRSAAEVVDPAETATDFTLAPLVDAFGIARVLAEAVKELDSHISSETRKVGDTVGRQLNTLQASVQELYGFLKEQRSTNLAVHEQLQRLAAAGAETDARQAVELDALRTLVRESSESGKQRIDLLTASLNESDTRQSSELEALRTQTTAFSSSVSERIDSLRADVGIQQEDIAAVKTELGALSPRIDALAEQIHRQGDALRLMQTTYSQRETELEQLVDGLARLRAFPKPQPADEF